MTDTRTDRRAHWQQWLHRWDVQQTAYVPDREDRFSLMLDVVEEAVGDRPTVLDLACGPGSISQRLLARFPEARSVAVDADTALLHVGREALGDLDGRLAWVQADLREDGWVDRLGVGRVDAVLSATATHWLSPDDLAPIYRALRTLLRPGGVYVDADHLPEPAGPLDDVVDRVRARHRTPWPEAAESWEAWWDALAAEPELADDLAARDHIGSGHHDTPTYEDHVAALRAAGFSDVRSIRQGFSDRILLAS